MNWTENIEIGLNRYNKVFRAQRPGIPGMFSSCEVHVQLRLVDYFIIYLKLILKNVDNLYLMILFKFRFKVRGNKIYRHDV